MIIFQYKEMIGLAAVSFASFFLFYIVLSRWPLKIGNTNHVCLFFIIWCSFFALEYYVFGSLSFVGREVDGHEITLQNYLAQDFGAARFSHEYGGGQDLTTMVTAQHYFHLERALLHLFPIWVVVLIHKVMLAALGFAGCYLLALPMAAHNRSIAVSLAAVFPVSHIYLLNYSLEFGTGFAVIPLAVYVCVFRTRQKNYYYWVAAVAAVLGAAEPMKVFPPLLVAVIAGMLLSDRVDIRRTVVGFVIFALISIINWHETIFAIYQIIGFTERGDFIENEAKRIFETLSNISQLFIDMWVFSLLILVSAVILAVKRDKFIYRTFCAVGFFIFAYVAAVLFPWKAVGLGLVGGMEHAYMRLALPVLGVLVAARAFAHLSDEASRWRAIRPEAALLAMALSLLVWNKFLNVSLFLAFGGHGSLTGFEVLKNTDWRDAGDYRAITMFETPRPNVVAGFYGIESFDGTTIFYEKRWDNYWSAIKRRLPPAGRIEARPVPDWSYLNGQVYELEKELRPDLLRIANVRYVISALPLEGKSLRLLVDSKKKDWPKARPEFFGGTMDYLRFRARRIFDPGKHFIYEFPDPLPRVFVASGVDVIDDNIEPAAFYERIETLALDGTVVVKKRHSAGLSASAALRVLSYEKVTDGYDISVDAADGGILVLNNTYLPFWEAQADGQPLKIVPVNAIHMAISLPPGAREIEVRYRRPLLREKLLN